MPQHPDDRRPRRRSRCLCGHSYSAHRVAEHLRRARGACRASVTLEETDEVVTGSCSCREYRPVASRPEIPDAEA